MTNSKEKLTQIKVFNSVTKLLANEFYNLRKAFEAGYSGPLRSHKYEESRDFTITLNYAIFQVNQLDNQETGISQKTLVLEKKLKALRKDFKRLKT